MVVVATAEIAIAVAALSILTTLTIILVVAALSALSAFSALSALSAFAEIAVVAAITVIVAAIALTIAISSVLVALTSVSILTALVVVVVSLLPILLLLASCNTLLVSVGIAVITVVAIVSVAATLVLIVKTSDAILLSAVCWLFNLVYAILIDKRLNTLSSAIHSDNLSYSRSGDSHNIRHSLLATAERHCVSQYVGLNQVILSIDSLQWLSYARQSLTCIGIDIILIHQATFQLRALSRQLQWVERDVLNTSGICRYA